MSQELLGRTKYRQLKGPVERIETALLSMIVAAGSFYMLGVHEYFGLLLLKEQYLGFFLGLSLAATFLGVPHSKGSSKDRVPWFDSVFASMGLLVGLYVAIVYPRILEHLGVITPERWLLGAVAILLVLEAVRRLVGWSLVIVAAAFILYTRFSHWAPGSLSTPGVSWERLAAYLYLDSNALLGLVFTVGATVVLAYMLFGNLLFACGGGKILTDLALTMGGRFSGGPAKIAVIGSALFGTLSGSSAANVVVTGSVTIPMMKRVGFKAEMAAAIEATAANGGLIMPPVMGAVAFVMAEVLRIPYARVALAATLPAVLYYLCVLTHVHLYARKHNLRGLPPSAIPSILSVVKGGWWIAIPIGVLVYLLFVIRVLPEKAALGAVVMVLAIGMIVKQSRQYLLHSAEWVKSTGRAVMELGAILAGASFVVGAINLSGLAVALPWRLVDIAGGNVFLLLVLVAIVNIILGLGLPAVPVYLLLAVLTAPALVNGGIVPLAAHMFILYYGVLSMVTPPDCIAAFTAASIAGSPPMRTGWLASLMSLVAYIVPWVFVYNPSLLLIGTPVKTTLTFLGTLLGMGYLLCGVTGYCLQNLGWLSRVIVILCGTTIIYLTALAAWSGFFGRALGLGVLLIGTSILVMPFVARRLHLSKTA